MTYRLVPDNMVSGLWIDPLPVTVQDFQSLMQHGAARHVTHLRFQGTMVSPWSSPLTVSWREDVGERVQKSLYDLIPKTSS
jgi:hypothetical protein